VSNKKNDGTALGNIHTTTGINSYAKGIANKIEYGINFKISRIMFQLIAF